MTAQVSIVQVTPKLAKTWLAENTHNRNLRKSHVQRFVGIIKRHEWQLTNDALTFNGDGKLLNGQHRLHAIVEADMQVPLIVFRQATSEAQDVMDTGVKRNVADALKLRGETDVHVLAGAVRQVWYYKHGLPLAWNQDAPSPQQVFRTLDANPQIRRACKVAHQATQAGLQLPPTIVAALRYLFSLVDEDEASAFFGQLFLGADLEAVNPIFALRKALIGAAMRTQERKSRRWYAAVLIKAFNAWREGEDVKAVYWRGGGLSPEPFPKINGLKPRDIG